ncbi:MAG: protein-L-isoaspartate(D-aspartate) O-methyltransferase [Sphingobacteriales bacterium]|jgi:protein-L-isoaspartate(D-aspartate) O-methyltransferase
MKGDSFKNKGMRLRLIDDLRNKGIQNESVLRAMEAIPRHIFMDSALENFGYQDLAFPIGFEQTISQPYTVARQTELLEVKSGHKVLEIGTGSAYQSWVLFLMGAQVHSIERIEGLHKKAKQLIAAYNIGVRTYLGDGFIGLPELAPFDRIIVTCGAPHIPEALLEQLAVGGIMVIPVGDGKTQTMKKIVRKTENSFSQSEYGDFSFVPMKKDIQV